MANKRVSFSDKELPIKEIEEYYSLVEKALRQFYNEHNLLFAGYTHEELNNELEDRIEELDKSTALTILAAMEAHIRIDYLQRCYNKDKQTLSKKFRNSYKTKGLKMSFEKVPLEKEILSVWKDHVSNKSVVSDIIAALNYRHWLAHGRYWVVKVGRRYDFHSILTLAVKAQDQMSIDMGA